MKVSVIGAGAVGTEVVNSLRALGGIREIVLVNRNQPRASAAALDFLHTNPFVHASNSKVRAGTIEETKHSNIVVLSSGIGLAEDGSRESLATQNWEIVAPLVKQLAHECPDAMLLVVSNPTEVLSQMIVEQGLFPSHRVLSSGTVIDTSRLHLWLGQKLGLDPRSLSGFVLGMHGADSFVAWELCKVCGIDLNAYCNANGAPQISRAEALECMRAAGLQIWRDKGDTRHGVAASVLRILRSIMQDELSVLPVGVYLDRYCDVRGQVLSVPCVISNQGVQKVLEFPWSNESVTGFHQAARSVQQMVSYCRSARPSETGT